jgi:hypothetical protein
MAINIKELFSTDSSNIQLDKINYNFDQIVANGGGPIGLTGSKGDVGPQGAKGDKGDTGSQGVKGEPGTATDYFVREEYSGDYYSLSPVSDALHGSPAAIVLGNLTVPGDSPEDLGDEVPLKLYSRLSGSLRLADMGSAYYVDVESRQSGGNFTLNFNKSPLGSGNYIYTFNGETLNLKSGGVNKVTLGATTSTFNSALVLNSSLQITSGAQANRYLKSDASGNASWATLTTAVPVGTIVMVSKFVLDSNVTWSTGIDPTTVATDYIGRGTGSWEGWYYCWGKTWVSGSTTYETPDMRERYPIGYVHNNITFSGVSTDVNSAAVGAAIASTTAIAGYFGTNDVDNLQSKNISTAAHNHTINNVANGSGYSYAQVATGTTSKYVPYVSSSTGELQTSTSGTSLATNNDISPRSAVVGFMIYLGNTALEYSTGAIAGAQGPQGDDD